MHNNKKKPSRNTGPTYYTEYAATPAKNPNNTNKKTDTNTSNPNNAIKTNLRNLRANK